MAFVIPETAQNKGIMIVKHVEYKYFNAVNPGLIADLRKRFLVGLYYGFYSERRAPTRNLDFVVAAKDVIPDDQALPRLMLNGFHFIDDKFGLQIEQGRSYAKNYDFLFVGNYQKRKGLVEFLLAFAEVAEASPKVSALIIVINNDKDRTSRRRTRTGQLVAKIRNSGKGRIKLIEINKTFGEGLPSEFIELAMHRSRSVIVPSFMEGAARVVAEAEMCGVPVILREDCKGGSASHLDPDMNILFQGQAGLLSAMKAFLAGWETIFSKKVPNDAPYRQSLSKDVLVRFFTEKFAFDEAGLRSHVDQTNFYNALSSHCNFLPEKFSNPVTDEVYSSIKFQKLICHLLGRSEVSGQKARVTDLFFAAEKRLRYTAGLVLGRR